MKFDNSKVPTSVTIAGVEVGIKRTRSKHLWGWYDEEQKTIWLHRNFDTMERFKDTLRHEMMEASLFISGVAYQTLYDQEPVVRCMENIFFPAWDSLNL